MKSKNPKLNSINKVCESPWELLNWENLYRLFLLEGDDASANQVLTGAADYYWIIRKLHARLSILLVGHGFTEDADYYEEDFEDDVSGLKEWRDPLLLDLAQVNEATISRAIPDWDGFESLFAETINSQIEPESEIDEWITGPYLSGDEEHESIAAKAISQSTYEDDDYLNDMAIEARNLKEWKISIDLFERAIQLNPKVPEYHLNLADSLLKSGQLKRCQEQAEALLKEFDLRKELRSDAYSRIGECQMRRRNFEAACEAFRLSLEAEPSFARASWLLGDSLLKLGRYQDAAWSYARFHFYWRWKDLKNGRILKASNPKRRVKYQQIID